ncbi:MAG: DUF1697 domain-containing protein [Pseudonocardiaceae bacterium]
MPTHVALLRGINVGGRNRVAMADLRALVTSLTHTDVATYIQNGNVVFTSTQTDTTAIAAALEHAIAESLSVRPTVVVLSRDTLSRVVADNPYPDETTVLGHTLYLHTPDGLGRSELAAQLARSGGPLAAAGSATVRNWATVTKLLAMLSP